MEEGDSRRDIPIQRLSTTERERLDVGSSTKPLHIICLDESRGAEKAIRFAMETLPKDHGLLLVHGIREGYVMGRDDEDVKQERRRIENRFMQMCNNYGRDCRFKHFHFTRLSDFGEEVCDLAERRHAKSVIIGRREDVSDMRRSLVGSASQSVLSACSVPVTVVNDTSKREY